MNKGVVLHSGSGLWLSPFRYATGAQPQTAEEWKNCWKLFTENCWIFICQFHVDYTRLVWHVNTIIGAFAF